MLDWVPILQKGAEALAKPLLEAAFSATPGLLKSLANLESLNFEPHFKYAFERCTKLKTLYSRDVAIDLLSNYVNLRFNHQSSEIDDIAMIDTIIDKKHIVISNSGGAGKSIFLRYFWISTFLNPRKKIPVFLELRRFNDIDSDFTTFLYHHVVSSTAKSAETVFNSVIATGRFIFVFDGFDELTQIKRQLVEDFILTTSGQFEENVFVISGRPDTRFDSWQRFSTYRICPFNAEQAQRLIAIVECDNDRRKGLIQLVKSKNIAANNDFFSLPLLIIMMIISFRYHKNVQSKLHLFYSQAFEALFHAHDGLKEQFVRQRLTSLDVYQFKLIFSWFSLRTYKDQKIEFERSEAIELISQACNDCSISAYAQHLLNDIEESVCLIQTDGLVISFSHRSFQEYFTAYCLSTLSKEIVSTYLDHVTDRPGDNVVPMLYDMNRALAEQAYLVPRINDVERHAANIQRNDPYGFCDAYRVAFVILADTHRDHCQIFTLSFRNREVEYLFNVLDQISSDPGTRTELNNFSKKFKSKSKHPFEGGLHVGMYIDDTPFDNDIMLSFVNSEIILPKCVFSVLVFPHGVHIEYSEKREGILKVFSNAMFNCGGSGPCELSTIDAGLQNNLAAWITTRPWHQALRERYTQLMNVAKAVRERAIANEKNVSKLLQSLAPAKK